MVRASTITRHGEAQLAQLVPAKPARDPQALEALVEEISAHRQRPLGSGDQGSRTLIHEGHKY